MKYWRTSIALFVVVLFPVVCILYLSEPWAIDGQDKKSASEAAPVHLTFLSDSDPLYRLLENMQQVAYQDDPRAFRWTGDIKQIQVLIEACGRLDKRPDVILGQLSPKKKPEDDYSRLVEKLIENLGGSVPTRFEDPLSLAILRQLINMVEPALDADFPMGQRPRFGSLPLLTVNAKVIGESPSNCLIIVHSGLFSFCHEMLKVALDTVTFADGGGTDLEIDLSEETFNEGPRRNPKLAERLARNLEDFSNGRRLVGTGPPERIHDSPLARMVEAMELFTICHEYGHVALKHSCRTEINSVYGQNEKVLTRAWSQEAAADLYGARLLQRIVQREWDKETDRKSNLDWREFKRFGPVLFLEFAAIAEEAQYIFTNHALPPQLSETQKNAIIGEMKTAVEAELKQGDISDLYTISKDVSSSKEFRGLDSHPPAWVRKTLLEHEIRNSVPADATEEGKDLAKLAAALSSNMRTLWEDIEPLWLEACNASN